MHWPRGAWRDNVFVERLWRTVKYEEVYLIFEPVIEAAWTSIAPRTALAPPSLEARRQLSCKSVDLESGEAKERGGKVITECFRVDARGRIIDTQTRLVSGESARAGRDRDDDDTAPRRRLGTAAYDQRSAHARLHPRRPTVAVQAVPQWAGQQQWGGAQWGQR